MQPVEHLPAAAPDAVELAGAAAAPSGGRCDGASGVFATLGLQLERVQATQAPGVRVEVWFQDEARIGQKNSLTRVWGQTGSRPVAPKDLGFASAYLLARSARRPAKPALAKAGGGGTDHADLQYRGDEPPPDRDQQPSHHPPLSRGQALPTRW